MRQSLRIFLILLSLQITAPDFAMAQPVSFEDSFDLTQKEEKTNDLDLFQIDQILSNQSAPDRYSISNENPHNDSFNVIT